MTPLQNSADAAVAEVFARHDAELDSELSDRRDARRHAFPVFQRMAPYDGIAVPAESGFHSIRCHDLSTSGFSFYWPLRPEFDQLVLALESPKEGTRFLLAQVAFECQRPEVNGQFLIGCRFLRRLK